MPTEWETLLEVWCWTYEILAGCLLFIVLNSWLLFAMAGHPGSCCAAVIYHHHCHFNLSKKYQMSSKSLTMQTGQPGIEACTYSCPFSPHLQPCERVWCGLLLQISQCNVVCMLSRRMRCAEMTELIMSPFRGRLVWARGIMYLLGLQICYMEMSTFDGVQYINCWTYQKCSFPC